ncbi:uncharacterized protein LOC143148083 isoform X2 [Ptiloglossa arizonensis]|uniref:uncharacterized protein LOC143148083 isoform X2 n=1 Tax=Ptiloglossa arizonensis TaxID=3350558 RepID=UPI003FA0BAED
MDDKMISKKKHLKYTESQIKELLENKIKLMDYLKNNRDQHSDEDEMKIKDLVSKITSMKENLQSEKQTLEYKDHDLTKHLKYITKLETEKCKFLEENQSLQLQKNKFRACKQNLKDQELLEKGRKKYMLYRELTRIRWDYEDLKENVKGIVSNKRDFIHHFSYKNEITKDLTDLLWQEIYKSTLHKVNEDECNKENIE